MVFKRKKIMKLIILTQNEPFYLYDNLKYLLGLISGKHVVVGCVVFDASPFGKIESPFSKAKKTYNIFGLRFFMYYSFLFLYSKIFKPGISRLMKKNKIDIININGNINSNSNIEILKSFDADLFVSILGNQIFKRPLLDIAKYGCINLHTALLPKYRGLMPTFWVLKNNEKYTGVSVFFVDEGIDSGEILVQEKIEILDRSQASLIRLTKKIGMEAIAKSIDLIQFNNYKLIKNNSEEMTYYRFPTRKDVKEFRKLGKSFF